MARQFLPRETGKHRVACFALYRALLQQCIRIPIPAELQTRGPVNPLKHLIRKQFRNSVWLTSPVLCVAALKRGYAAETLLRTAGDGNTTACSQIISLLQTRHTLAVEQAASQPPPKPKSFIRYPEPYAHARKVIEAKPLPLSQLSGRRHVPAFAVAQSSTFLRYNNKEHNPFLSRILRQNNETEIKLRSQIDLMDEYREMGAAEDKWELLVERQMRREGKAGDSRVAGYEDGHDDAYEEGYKDWVEAGYEAGYEDAFVDAKDDVSATLRSVAKRQLDKAAEFTKIYIKEKELFEQERRERKHARNQAKLAITERRL